MKKILSIVLAAAMGVSMTFAAFASTGSTVTGDGKNAKVPLYADVTAADNIISVVMPTQITFQIGATDGAFSTLVSGTGEFSNNSTCAVDLSIIKVIDPTVGNTTFLSIIDLALGTSVEESADVMLDEARYLRSSLTVDDKITLGRIYADSKETYKVFGQDNAKDTTTLPDGTYKIETTIKVEPVVAS